MIFFWECEGGHLGEDKAFFFECSVTSNTIKADKQFWLFSSYEDWCDEKPAFEANGELPIWERCDGLIPESWKSKKA